jgi:hypothetical protein
MTTEQVQKVLATGIDLNQYILMNLMASKEDFSALRANVKIQGWLNMLAMKGLIVNQDGALSLTESGKKMVSEIGEDKIDVKVDTKKYDWAALHARLKEELKKQTGKAQYQLEVKGREYPYLPGVFDLKSRIEKFIEKYQLADIEKIEKCLVRHIGIRNQKMVYYIMREKGDAKSDLAGDYEGFEDLKEVKSKGVGATVDI